MRSKSTCLAITQLCVVPGDAPFHTPVCVIAQLAIWKISIIHVLNHHRERIQEIWLCGTNFQSVVELDIKKKKRTHTGIMITVNRLLDCWQSPSFMSFSITKCAAIFHSSYILSGPFSFFSVLLKSSKLSSDSKNNAEVLFLDAAHIYLFICLLVCLFSDQDLICHKFQ